MNNATGYAPGWIADKVRPQTPSQRSMAWIQSMTARSENTWKVGTVVIQVALTGLLGYAVWSTKTLADHESRLNATEEWRREKGPAIEELRREFSSMRERSASLSDQVRGTDQIARDISASVRVLSDSMIRLQEGQARLNEKLVAWQVKQDKEESK
jgi:hypothetical protein